MPARQPYPSELQERFIVRLPDGMREQIAAAARANKRSMNAEIVARLEQSFRNPQASQDALGRLTADDIEALIHLANAYKNVGRELKRGT